MSCTVPNQPLRPTPLMWLQEEHTLQPNDGVHSKLNPLLLLCVFFSGPPTIQPDPKRQGGVVLGADPIAFIPPLNRSPNLALALALATPGPYLPRCCFEAQYSS